MALHEKKESTGNFLAIKHGSIVMESKVFVEGWEEIHPQNPKDKQPDGSFGTVTKWIKRYAALDGIIKKLEWYDRTHGDNRFMGLKIHVKDGPEYFQLDLPMHTRQFDSFTKLMENIDYEKVVQFEAWHDKLKDQTAFVVRQNGETVKWKYTKDDMGECPPAVQNRVGKWNFDDQKEWLINRLLDVVIPHVDAIHAFDEPEPEYTGTEEHGDAYEEPPFNPTDDEAPDEIEKAHAVYERS